MKKCFKIMLFLSAVSFYGKSQTWNVLGNGFYNAFPSVFYSGPRLLIGVSGINAAVCGIPVKGICSFDGENVDSLERGVDGGGINAMQWYNGKLIVGGNFAYAGGPTQWSIPFTRRLAAWDSINGWSSITPLGHPDSQVNAISEYQGSLYIGGSFLNVNNVSVNRIAKWNGTTWSNVSGGVNGFSEHIFCMAVYHGELYVGGDFSMVGSSNLPTYCIARWNGTQWDSVGGGLNAPPLSLVVDTIRDVVYAGGYFTRAGNVTAYGVAQWNDTVWSVVGHITDTLSDTRCMTMFNGELYAGGASRTYTAQGDTLNYIYKFNGTDWISVGGGTNNLVNTMSCFEGNLYVGGSFSQVGNNIQASHIVCYGTTCPTSVGIAEQIPPVPFRMFPNPNDDVLHIESEEPNQLVFRLRNGTGQFIVEKKFYNKLDYSTKGFAAGTYFVEVSLEDGSRLHVEKLIVK